MIQLNPDFLASEFAFADFIERFEQGIWPHRQWTHAAHLAVASWYLLSLPENDATERVRAGILRYNQAVGTPNTADSGYHETLTLFWLRVLSDFLGRHDNGKLKLDRIREAVAEFGPRRDLYREYYSFDVLKSREARAQWVPPDRPIEFTREQE